MIPRIYVALAVVSGLLATWGAYVAGVWAADLVGWAVGLFTFATFWRPRESV